jgi:hypothetical protein
MITKEDFKRPADFLGIGPAKDYYWLVDQNFEIAKKMAIEFAQWLEDNYKLGSDKEKSFQLYQQQK